MVDRTGIEPASGGVQSLLAPIGMTALTFFALLTLSTVVVVFACFAPTTARVCSTGAVDRLGPLI